MLTLEGISKTFQTGADRVVAARAIDLAFDRGDFVTIIGSNGAGKSTLLSLIAGTFPPTKGRVLLGERDITNVPAHR
jgi:putative ABC transport system ATP-binding protein